MFKTMVLKEKYIDDLESLIQQGVDLQYGMINELKKSKRPKLNLEILQS